MRVRFREVYYVQWISGSGAVTDTETMKSRKLVQMTVDWLTGAGMVCWVYSRTVREEKRWYSPFWKITGTTKWFETSLDNG